MVRHGIQQGAALTTLVDVVALSVGLLVVGWLVVSALNVHRMGPAEALTAALGFGLALPSIAAALAWLTGLGLRGDTVFTAAGSVLLAAFVLFRRGLAVTEIGRATRFDVFAAAGGAVAASLAAVAGPWLSQDADTFYHLAAARSLLHYGDALPRDVFFGTPANNPDATSGSFHVVLALLSLLTGMIPAWTALTIVGTVFSLIAFALFAREATRSQGAAAVATLLYAALSLDFDFRTSAYPNRIGPGMVWLALVYFIRFVRAGRGSPADLAAACILSFAAGVFYSGMSPVLVVVVVATFAIAAFIAVLRRRNRDLRPIAIATVAIVAIVVPVLVIRVVAIPGPGLEASFATEAAPIKVHVLLGYPFLDFRFWFDGFITVTTVGTLCLAGRAFRALAGEDAGAAVLWAATLVVPAVCFTPFLASSASGLFYFARVAGFLLPFVFVPLGWELSYQAPVLWKAVRTPVAMQEILPALALIVAIVYLVATGLRDGAIARYAGPGTFTVAASRANDLTARWADRIAALEAAGAGTLLADVDVSYEIAGLTGRRVVAVPYSHMPFQDEARDGILRRGDVADALNPKGGPLALPQVLVRYGVRFVLVDRQMDGAATWDWIARQRELVEVASGPGWRLLKFDSTLLDIALDIPLKQQQQAGVAPDRATAGRPVFVRVASAGAAGVADITLTGTTSRATVRARVDVGPGAGATATAIVMLPDALPVDRYQVAVTVPAGGDIVAGDIEVGRAYEAESFAGVFDFYNEGYARLPGWVSTYGSRYSRGAAAIGVRTGAVASHPLADPLASYCVELTSFGSGSVEVGLGDATASFTWTGSVDTAGTYTEPVHAVSGPRELRLWIPAGSPAPVTVDRIALYPSPLSGGGQC